MELVKIENVVSQNEWAEKLKQEVMYPKQDCVTRMIFLRDEEEQLNQPLFL
jgi:hypothetical protein